MSIDWQICSFLFITVATSLIDRNGTPHFKDLNLLISLETNVFFLLCPFVLQELLSVMMELCEIKEKKKTSFVTFYL